MADGEDGPHDEAGLRPMLTERMVLDLVPISRTTLYRLERAGKFPRSVYVSANRRLWFRDQIVAWQAAVDEHDERWTGGYPLLDLELTSCLSKLT